MHNSVRRLFLFAVLVGLCAQCLAAELSRADQGAIRAVVAAQLEAFAKDDAPRAFSLATNAIRARFGSPELFMRMVRTEYSVVYRPRSVQFEDAVVRQDEVLQPVTLFDAQGVAWLAIYPMQREPDGTWRIDGCQLTRLPGRPV